MSFSSATRLITTYLLQQLTAVKYRGVFVNSWKKNLTWQFVFISVGVKPCWSSEINRMVVRRSYHPWLSGTCLCSWDALAVTTFGVICFSWHWPGLGLLSQARPWDSSTVTTIYLNVSHSKAMPLKLPVQFNKTDPEGKQWNLLVRMPPVLMVKSLWRRLKSPWSQFLTVKMVFQRTKYLC